MILSVYGECVQKNGLDAEFFTLIFFVNLWICILTPDCIQI
jgi:hypothetical protein